MLSVTKPSHMLSVRPAMLKSSCKKHSYEECPVRPASLCDDKNCQSARCVHIQKPAMPQCNYKKVTQSTQLCRKQIGTQPEITRNCQGTTSKCCYPSGSTNVCPDTVKMQSNHMWPVKAELKKSQANTRSQLQTSKCKRDTNPQA